MLREADRDSAPRDGTPVQQCTERMLDHGLACPSRETQSDVVRVRSVQPRSLAVEGLEEPEDLALQFGPVVPGEPSVGPGVGDPYRAGGGEHPFHLGLGDSERPSYPARIHPGSGGSDRVRDRLLRVARLDRVEPGEASRAGASALGRERVDDGAAAHRARRRLIADDDPVTRERVQGMVGHELDPPALSGGDAAGVEDRQPRRGVRRGEMRVHRGPVPQRPRFPRQDVQAHVDAVGGCMQGAVDDPVASGDRP